MVIKYIRMTAKANWTAEDSRIAKQDVAKGLSIRKAAENFKILQILKSHCKSDERVELNRTRV